MYGLPWEFMLEPSTGRALATERLAFVRAPTQESSAQSSRSGCNSSLDSGFTTGTFNKRGVTTRSQTEGGRQEYELVISSMKSGIRYWIRGREPAG